MITNNNWSHSINLINRELDILIPLVDLFKYPSNNIYGMVLANVDKLKSM